MAATDPGSLYHQARILTLPHEWSVVFKMAGRISAICTISVLQNDSKRNLPNKILFEFFKKNQHYMA